MLSEFLDARMGQADSRLGLPLHRQLYEALRRALLDGKLAPGDRLPSSRELAQDLRLSRNTVVAAISQLTVEGYLRSRVGSGTYVHENLSRASRSVMMGRSPQAVRLSRRGETLAHEHGADLLEVQPFTPGAADFSAFPLALWQRLQNKHWRTASPEMLDYGSAGGYAQLRHAVANHLRVSRSVVLDAEQVIITSGTQQSLGLCALLLADIGDQVWIEDPAYWGAVKAFTAAGLNLYPVPVDEHGMAPQPGDHAAPPRLIYVTPSHQYPSGWVMSPARRQEVLAAARTHQAWVLEDDYDSEFRFAGAPLSSMQGLDTEQQVLYMGSFSKVLYPGLKLGYLVVPPRLVQPFRQAHYDLNRPGQMPVQAALAEFMDMGHFVSALRRARQSYAARRQSLLSALAPCLGGQVYIAGAEQGLHLCLRLPPGCDDTALARTLAGQGLNVRPLSAYCLLREDISGLVIGYGYAPHAEIAQHGPKLARGIERFLSAFEGAGVQSRSRRR